MAYKDIVLADSPFLFFEEWPTNQGSGSVSLNKGANSNYGSPGIEGNYISFNGSGASYAGLSGFEWAGGSYTVEMWVNPTFSGSSATRRLFAYNNGNAVLSVMFNDTNRKISCYAGPLASFSTIDSTNSIPADSWSHVAVTHVLSTGLFTIYINGVVDQTATVTVDTTVSGGTATLGHGNSGAAVSTSVAANGYVGLLDNVAYYKTALSQSRIAARYQYFFAPKLSDSGIPGRLTLSAKTIYQPQFGAKAPKVIDAGGPGTRLSLIGKGVVAFLQDVPKAILAGTAGRLSMNNPKLATILKGSQNAYTAWSNGNYIYIPGDGTSTIPVEQELFFGTNYQVSGFAESNVEHVEGRYGYATKFPTGKSAVTFLRKWPEDLSAPWTDNDSDGYRDGYSIDMWFKTDVTGRPQFIYFFGDALAYRDMYTDAYSNPPVEPVLTHRNSAMIRPDGSLIIKTRAGTNEIVPSYLVDVNRVKRVAGTGGTWTDVPYVAKIPQPYFVADGNWHHLAVAETTAERRFDVWLDGVRMNYYVIDPESFNADSYKIKQAGFFTGSNVYGLRTWPAVNASLSSEYAGLAGILGNYGSFVWSTKTIVSGGETYSLRYWKGSAQTLGPDETIAYRTSWQGNFGGLIDEFTIHTKVMTTADVLGRIGTVPDHSVWSASTGRLTARGGSASIAFGPKALDTAPAMVTLRGGQSTLLIRTPLGEPKYIGATVGRLTLRAGAQPTIEKVLIPIINYQVYSARMALTTGRAQLSMSEPPKDSAWKIRVTLANKKFTMTGSGR